MHKPGFAWLKIHELPRASPGNPGLDSLKLIHYGALGTGFGYTKYGVSQTSA